MTDFITNVAYYQTQTGDKILYPFSPPIFQTEVDSKFTKELIEEGRKLNIQEDDWNPRLAGNLKYGRSYHYKEEYLLKVEPYLKTYIQRFFDGLYQQYGSDYEGIDAILDVQYDRKKHRQGNLKLDTLWINFSQKHDFNPPHTHTGKLSFVIFCQVPKEIFTVQADSNTKRAGQLSFINGEAISPLRGNEFPVQPYENLMFIFPNNLQHYVSSYWVDAERISVSGNFIVI